MARPTGACAKGVNRWQKYSRSRVHRNVRLALALPMKNAPSHRCSTPVSRANSPAAPFETGFVRQGLKVGLELEQELGFNPLQVGFIAATDSHNSNPGDVEEWDFRGCCGHHHLPGVRRLSDDDRVINPTNPFSNSIHRAVWRRYGHLRIPAKRSLMPSPAAKPMPHPARAWRCASMQAGTLMRR